MNREIFSIIVIYNGMKKNWIQKCFNSIFASSIAIKIIAIDNSSTDESVIFIKENYPQVKLFIAKTNLGFAKANNIGIKYALENNADYFFLLNQDAWVEFDTIEKLVNIAEIESKFGLFIPIHLNSDKSAFEENFLRYFYTNSSTKNAYEYLYLKKEEPNFYETNFVNAAAWLLTKKCIETVGGFDTIMFRHYGEDNNYCHRILYHNLKIAIVPAATICHDCIDRTNRPIVINNVFYAIMYSNLLLSKKDRLKHLLNIFLKIIFLKDLKNSLKEIMWIISNFKKLFKSRKINIRPGNGLIYITNSLDIPN